jgi:hypothetical protein
MIVKLLDAMILALEGLKVDAAKFDEKKNSSAGTRVRVGMQNVKGQAQTVRLAIAEAKKD